MSKTDHKPPDKTSAAELPGAPKGRVVHDTRGNAKWEFDVLTGKFKSTASQLLKKLETSGLEVQDDSGLSLGKADPGAGYDPYNRVSSKDTAKPGAKVPPGKIKGRP